jgi:hypothetical protein
MPWLNRADYTRLVEERDQLLREREESIRENERAKVSLSELERLRESCAQLTKELERERERNRKREERFLDRAERLVDRVIVSKGASGVITAAERKEETKKSSSSSIPLTALEEAELKMYIESASENGFGPNVGRRMFERDRLIKLNPQADLSQFDDLPVIQPLDEINDDFEGVTEAVG